MPEFPSPPAPLPQGEGRSVLIAEARRWLGTPYHSNADILGAGVDCGMLLVRVFVDAGFVAPFDPRPYPQDWHLHRDGERYLGFVTDHLALTETPAPGDVVVFRIGRCYSHGGIVTALKPLTIVHAYINAGAVREDWLPPEHELMKPIRAPRFYTLWPDAPAPTPTLPRGAGEGAESAALASVVRPPSSALRQ